MNYFGYSSLEACAAVVDRTRPVYAIALLGSAASSSAPEHRQQVIQVAQPDECGDIHYCRLVIGSLVYLHGTPFGPAGEHRARQARLAGAWAIVRDWLVEEGLTVREASVALPEGYRWMEGWASFLGWDEAAQRFFREPVEECSDN